MSLPNSQKGYSMIELLVASVVGLFILSGAVTVFTGNKSSQELSSGMARLQESGRVALDILSNDIRLTGFQGCTDGTVVPQVIAVDAPDITLPQGALWGSEFTNNTWAPTVIPDVSNLNVTGAKPKAFTDVIYVQHGSGRSTLLASDMTDTSGPINLALNPDQLRADDLILISNCSNADIFRATAVDDTPAGVQVTFAAGAVNTTSTLSTQYQLADPTGNRINDPMRVMRFESNAYYIADSGRIDGKGDEIFSLFVLDTTEATNDRKGVELVEGVEDMQILYGEKLLNGNIRYLPASNASLNFDNVVSVQIGLLLTSTDNVANDEDTGTYMLADTTIGPQGGTASLTHSGGRMMRAAFNTTIQLRNRNSL